MKNILIGIALSAISLTACNNNGSNTTAYKVKSDTAETPKNDVTNISTYTKSSVQEIVTGYLQIKNALTADNGEEAANGGKSLIAYLQKFDESTLTPEQKKTYYDLEVSMKENAEHIGDNANKIDHQREHFEMLSQDMYDLIKAFGAGQILYKDFCPMAHNNKGATWISETKEIKNPYLGKKMPTCGEQKEEIK